MTNNTLDNLAYVVLGLTRGVPDVPTETPLASSSTLHSSSSPGDPLTDLSHLTTCTVFVFVAVGIIGSLAAVVGIIGNFLSFKVILKIGNGSNTFYILGALAVVDNIHLVAFLISSASYILIGGPIRDTTEQVDHESAWPRYIMYPINSMSRTCSIWICTLVTTYRYITALEVFKQKIIARKWVHLQIFAVVLLSILLDITKYWERQPSLRSELNCCGASLRTNDKLWKNDTYQLVYKTIVSLTFKRWLPMIITIIMAYKRFQLLQSWRKFRQQCLKKDGIPVQQEILSRLLIAMAVVFVICHLPSSLYPIIRLIDKNYQECSDHYYFYVYTISDLMVVLNSALAFLIFAPFIRKFKKTLQNILSARARIQSQISITSTMSSIRSRMSSLRRSDRSLSRTVSIPVDILGMDNNSTTSFGADTEESSQGSSSLPDQCDLRHSHSITLQTSQHLPPIEETPNNIDTCL